MGTLPGLTSGCPPCSSLSEDGNTCWAHPRIAPLPGTHWAISLTLPLLAHTSGLSFIQLTSFSPHNFPFRNNLQWLYVSTQKSTGLVQNHCLCKSHLYPSFTPTQHLNTANPDSTFPLRRWLPDWTSYVRASFSSNWQEGTWLCYCIWGESWGQVQRLGREKERESLFQLQPHERA